MSTIVDLSDDPKYTIKVVATQTGIRPVTLRAWERRHEVLTPHRAGNRYRLYSERDVAILRWLKNRVDGGISISSAVTELRGMTTKDVWPEALPAAPGPLVAASNIPPEQFVSPLFQALVKHDETRAGDLLREVHALYELPTVFMQVIVPALREIGEAWYRGEIRVTTEHYASSFLRGKLLALLQAYPSRRSAPFLLVGCAPMEQHELGSLMLAVMLRSQGYRVEYLGPDVPVEDLADYASYELPAMVILAASSEDSARRARRMQALLEDIDPQPIFGYGGRAFDLHPALRKEIAGNYLGATLEQAVQTVQSLLPVRAR